MLWTLYVDKASVLLFWYVNVVGYCKVKVNIPPPMLIGSSINKICIQVQINIYSLSMTKRICLTGKNDGQVSICILNCWFIKTSRIKDKKILASQPQDTWYKMAAKFCWWRKKVSFTGSNRRLPDNQIPKFILEKCSQRYVFALVNICRKT